MNKEKNIAVRRNIEKFANDLFTEAGNLSECNSLKIKRFYSERGYRFKKLTPRKRETTLKQIKHYEGF